MNWGSLFPIALGTLMGVLGFMLHNRASELGRVILSYMPVAGFALVVYGGWLGIQEGHGHAIGAIAGLLALLLTWILTA